MTFVWRIKDPFCSIKSFTLLPGFSKKALYPAACLYSEQTQSESTGSAAVFVLIAKSIIIIMDPL